jgi:hypothetical protein
MISRVTIFSLLLGLMLGVGIYAWAQDRRDDCTSYPPGGRAPATEMVVSGTREIEVPCGDWWLRQPLGTQILCIADAALGVVFLMNALQDTRGWLAMRRRRRMQ